VTEIVAVCPPQELATGTMRLVEWEDLEILVANCEGDILAMQNRCSHDNGPLNEGTLDLSACTVKCPRHGSIFDLRSGRAVRPPADAPLDTFPVHVEDEQIRLEVE
jgi:3-phenylpropionate/trans-cinnamate dioxygenase ferredoxin subunit